MLQNGMILQNRYQILQPLGQGGMGAVYLARDMRLGNILVAVKENSGGDARQFEQEAILLAQLRHPNLPRVQDHFLLQNGAQYLVMEYIEGTDLDSQLQNGALPETNVRAWFDQILDAVGYLHSRGVIHRDIKPANIRITPTGQAMLVDFGIAKIMQGGQKTLTGAKAVTPGFAAPEQYRGGTDARSDIYSLGATMYALLTGSVPPDAQSLERGSATLTKPRVLNRAISANAEQVIMQAMNVNSAARFADAGAMSQALRTSATIPATVASRNTATFPTRYVILGGLGAAVLGVCILSSLFFNSILNPTAIPTTILPTRVAVATFTPHPVPTATALPTNTQPSAPTAPPPTAMATTAPTAISTNLPSTESPTEIPPSSVVTGRALENLNIRAQPSTSAALLGKIPKDTRLTLLARTANSDWYQISLPDNTNGRGWVSAEFVEVTNGDVSTLKTDGATTFVPTQVPDQVNQPIQCTPSGNVIDLTNQVPDEIPGRPLALCETVSSVIDEETKVRDVYALDLVGGQEVRFTANPTGYMYFRLYYPDSQAIETNRYAAVFDYGSSKRWVADFMPAVSDTYYFAVRADDKGQRYDLTVNPTGVVIPAEQFKTDIPGTPLALGSTITSVIDEHTKVRDVFAIELTAGQEVRFTADPSSYMYFRLYYPDSKSIETNRFTQVFDDGSSKQWVREFLPAVSGTYYFAVRADDNGQTYSLTVNVTGTQTPAGDVATDIPGTPLALGESVSSVIDEETKVRDVYALHLVGGQEVRFTAIPNGYMYFRLYYPNSESIETNRFTKAFDDGSSNRWVRDFLPAVSGTYYFAVRSDDKGQKYTLTVNPTANVFPAGQVATDIPGTPLAIGTTATSVIDEHTKVRDVYAVQLNAGQEVRFTVEPTGYMYFRLYTPDSTSIEANRFTEVFDEGDNDKWIYDFTPSLSGTFYFAVRADNVGQSYRLTITLR